MKNFLMIAAALVVLACGTQSVQAQTNGYQFGVGLGYAGFDGYDGYGFNCHRNFFGLPIAPTPRIDAPPFFALYPPVYYSKDIVARPYGVSPFAAPPGIVPVEMGAIVPLHQSNPYFVEPMPSEGAPTPQDGTQSSSEEGQKTTWIRNAHFDPLAHGGQAVASK
jgi:hypothetical protein